MTWGDEGSELSPEPGAGGVKAGQALAPTHPRWATGCAVVAIITAALAALVMLPMVLFGAGLALEGVLPLWLVQSMLLVSMGAAYAYPTIFALFGILVVVSLALATAAAFGRGRWAGRAFIVVGVAGLLAVLGVGGTILGWIVPAGS